MEWQAAKDRLAALFPDDKLRGEIRGRLAQQPHFDRFFDRDDTDTRAALLTLLSGKSQPDPLHSGIDSSAQVLQHLLHDRSEHPPAFADLPGQLPLLPGPLPVSEQAMQILRADPAFSANPAAWAVRLSQQPAMLLSELYSNPLSFSADGRGEVLTVYTVIALVFAVMQGVLRIFDIQCELGGDVTDPSGAIEALKRPDAMLFMNSVLMFKAEAKVTGSEFERAVLELQRKMADWSPRLHGTRQYMLCLAAAGSRLRFYAVSKGGGQLKEMSREFDLRRPLHRLQWCCVMRPAHTLRPVHAIRAVALGIHHHSAFHQIVHAALAALIIVCQQCRHEVPPAPMPLGLTLRTPHSAITYHADFVVKEVTWATFANNDEGSLKHVYKVVLSLPRSQGLTHPRGLIRPLQMPKMRKAKGIWVVTAPLGVACRALTLPALGRLVADVLSGLCQLHAHGIVHRDVRLPNVVEMQSGGYVLIDYEHSGRADSRPPYPPLSHWPEECQVPNPTYSCAADVYSVGRLMTASGLELNEGACALRDSLTSTPEHRPSAQVALSHAWLASAPLA